MLKIRNLNFHYRQGEPILKDINLEIEDGRFVAILGNNGAGKSTLLKCLDGILKASSGEIYIDDKNLMKLSQSEIARKAAFVSQHVFDMQLSVWDCVMLGRKPYLKWNFTDKDRQIVSNALKQFDLEKLSAKYVSQLSGGEQQKVMLARALVQQPTLLLLDEPTSSLDIQNQYQVLKTVGKIVSETKISVLVIIHDLTLALRFCDRFVMMKDGRIYSYGDISTIHRQSIKDIYQIDADIIEINGKQMLVVD